MSKETNPEESWEKLKESTKKLDAVKNAIVSPQLQQIANTMQMMNNAIASDAMGAVINIGNRIAELASSVDFTPMLKKFSEAIIPIK